MDWTEREKAYLEELEDGIQRGKIHKKVEWATWFFSHPEKVTPEIALKMKEFYAEGVKIGLESAALGLGAMYYGGEFIPQDFSKAVEWYKIAARSQDRHVAVRATCNLGDCHGYGRDIPVDYKAAFPCFFKAAILFYDANSFYKLGDMYRYSNFVDKDETMTLE